MTSINLTFGAVFDGVTVSLMLYGITCCQTIQYYYYFPKDRHSLKGLVAFVWLVDTVHQVFLIHMQWHYLVVLRHTLDINAAMRANWSLIAQVVPTEMCAVIVESFYIARICNLDGRKRSLLLFVPISVSFLASLAYVVKCFKLPEFVSATKMRWLPGVFGCLRAFTDIAIAAIMCGLLYTQTQSSLSRRTISLVRVMVHYAVTTGVLTSVFATIYVVVYLSMPLNMIYMGVYFVHGKIYVNSMLAALNSRKSLRAEASQDVILVQASHFSLFQDTNPGSASDS